MKITLFVYTNALMLISRLRSFSRAPGGPGAYVFFEALCGTSDINNGKVRVTLCHVHASTRSALRCSCRSTLPCSGDFRWTRNFCSRGPRGLKFFMHSHPLMGGRPPKFKKKSTKFFFCLISPTHFPAYNSCSRGTRGLKFVMRIDPPHAGPTTTFLFIFSKFSKKTKIVHFFQLFQKMLLSFFKFLLIPTHFPAL